MMLHVNAVVVFLLRGMYGASHKEGRCLGTRNVEGLLMFRLNNENVGVLLSSRVIFISQRCFL